MSALQSTNKEFPSALASIPLDLLLPLLHATENCINTKKLMEELGVSSKQITDVTELKPGDHICYPTSYTIPGYKTYHHSIVKSVIDGKTVEIIQFTGKSLDKSSGKISKDEEDLSKYASEGSLYRIDYERVCKPASEVVKRAEEKIGDYNLHWHEYNLLFNNCEHFATWCKTGKAFSSQTCQMQEETTTIITNITLLLCH